MKSVFFSLLLVVLSSQAYAYSSCYRQTLVRLSDQHKFYECDFGEVRIAWPDYDEIYVVNDTDRIVYNHTFMVEGQTYIGSYTMCPYAIYPGDKCKISLKYITYDYGRYTGTFRMFTDAGTVYINMKGITVVVNPWPSEPSPE